MSDDHMINPKYFWNWVYCCSVAKSSEPMDCSTPGFPVPHHLPKFAQVYVHCIDDTIQSGTMMIPWNRVYTVVIKSTAIQIRCTTLPEPRDMLLLLSCILWLPKFFFFFFHVFILCTHYTFWHREGEVKVKIVQSCPTLWDPVDYKVHGILQARILEWVAFPFSRRSSQPRNRTQVSHIADGYQLSHKGSSAQGKDSIKYLWSLSIIIETSL